MPAREQSRLEDDGIKLPVSADIIASSARPFSLAAALTGFLHPAGGLDMKDRTLWRILGAAAALAMQTPIQAEEYRGTVEQQMACTPDVFRLCGSEIPDVNRIVACLRQNTPQLGPSCRAVFEAQNSVPPPVAPRDQVRTSRIAR